MTVSTPEPAVAAPDTTVISTQQWYIRRFVIADAEPMVKGANDIEVSRWLSDRFPHPFTLEDALSRIFRATEATHPTEYAIFKPDGRFVGSIGFTPNTGILHRTWRVGYWIAREFWGQGIASKVLELLSKWAFDVNPSLLRVEAEVYSTNDASARVLEKAGFTREGVREQAVEKNGVVMGLIMYRLLRSELRV